jgi:hypothetical protein
VGLELTENIFLEGHLLNAECRVQNFLSGTPGRLNASFESDKFSAGLDQFSEAISLCSLMGRTLNLFFRFICTQSFCFCLTRYRNWEPWSDAMEEPSPRPSPFFKGEGEAKVPHHPPPLKGRGRIVISQLKFPISGFVCEAEKRELRDSPGWRVPPNREVFEADWNSEDFSDFPEFQCESNRKTSSNASHIENSFSVKANSVNYYFTIFCPFMSHLTIGFRCRERFNSSARRSVILQSIVPLSDSCNDCGRSNLTSCISMISVKSHSLRDQVDRYE